MRHSIYIYMHIHYLPISNWTFSTSHLLLNIYKNTGRIILKFQGYKKTMLFFILFGCNFVLKICRGPAISLKAEHHVCMHPVKSVASNALSLQQMFMMLLSNIRINLRDSSSFINGNIIHYLKNMESFRKFFVYNIYIFFTHSNIIFRNLDKKVSKQNSVFKIKKY